MVVSENIRNLYPYIPKYGVFYDVIKEIYEILDAFNSNLCELKMQISVSQFANAWQKRP